MHLARTNVNQSSYMQFQCHIHVPTCTSNHEYNNLQFISSIRVLVLGQRNDRCFKVAALEMYQSIHAYSWLSDIAKAFSWFIKIIIF